jgi:hypothetical protein
MANLSFLEARLWAENESKPFVKIIMSVRNRERPTWLIKPNGEVEQVSDGLCERDKALVATCEAWIQQIHERAIAMMATAYQTPAESSGIQR